jgi:hypothetical protein
MSLIHKYWNFSVPNLPYHTYYLKSQRTVNRGKMTILELIVKGSVALPNLDTIRIRSDP